MEIGSIDGAKKRGIKIVETLHTIHEINDYITQGRKVVVMPITKNPELYVTRYLYRNVHDGTYVDASGREEYVQYGNVNHYPPEDYEEVHRYERYCHKSEYLDRAEASDIGLGHGGYAAYLLPEDIETDDYVYIPELIEHIVATDFWGPIPATDGYATWNGESLVINEEAYKSLTMIG